MKPLIEIIIKLSPLITVIISGIVSYIVAKTKARYEIKKTFLELNHQDKALFNSAFSTLMVLTEDYCDIQFLSTKNDAINANSTLMSVCPPCFSAILKEMDSALTSGNITEIKSVRNRLLYLYLQCK